LRALIQEMYVDGTLEPTADTSLDEIVDRIRAVIDCVCDFPAGACRNTHCRCHHHGYDRP
jgi:hypothetical protein